MFEFMLGWRTIQAVAEAIRARTRSAITQQITTRIMADDGPFKAYSGYVACFTERARSIHTQSWFKTMGKDRRLKFRIKPLIEALQRNATAEGFHVELLPVHYDQDDLISTADELIGIGAKVAAGQLRRRPLMLKTAAANRVYWALRNNLVRIALTYKRPRYRMEAEWRLIATMEARRRMPRRLVHRPLDKVGNPATLRFSQSVSWAT